MLNALRRWAELSAELSTRVVDHQPAEGEVPWSVVVGRRGLGSIGDLQTATQIVDRFRTYDPPRLTLHHEWLNQTSRFPNLYPGEVTLRVWGAPQELARVKRMFTVAEVPHRGELP